MLKDFLIKNEVPLLKNSDPLKIILHTSKFGLSGIEVDKIFVLIDLTDVSDEANRWEIKNNYPKLMNEKIFYKKNVGFSKFKK